MTQTQLRMARADVQTVCTRLAQAALPAKYFPSFQALPLEAQVTSIATLALLAHETDIALTCICLLHQLLPEEK